MEYKSQVGLNPRYYITPEKRLALENLILHENNEKFRLSLIKKISTLKFLISSCAKVVTDICGV